MTTFTEPPLVIFPECFLSKVEHAQTQESIIGVQAFLLTFLEFFGCKVNWAILNEITEPRCFITVELSTLRARRLSENSFVRKALVGRSKISLLKIFVPGTSFRVVRGISEENLFLP